MIIYAMKVKVCSSCDKIVPKLWKSSPALCKDCAMRIKAKQADLKPVKPRKPLAKYQTVAIKKISTKQQRLNAAYKILRDDYMKHHKYCEIKMVCEGAPSSELHHVRPRAFYLLDVSVFKAACHACHDYLNLHDALARALGHLKSKHGHDYI